MAGLINTATTADALKAVYTGVSTLHTPYTTATHPPVMASRAKEGITVAMPAKQDAHICVRQDSGCLVAAAC